MVNLIAVFNGSIISSNQLANMPQHEGKFSSDLFNISIVCSTTLEPQFANIAGEITEGFGIFVQSENGLKLLEKRNRIDQNADWVEVMVNFARNYTNIEPDDGGYRWGQIVPNTGDYLCKDCGYIEEFKTGQIFPICEVCLAGEPDGPSTPSQGYWEVV